MCIRAKVVVFGQKLVLFEQRWFNLGEMVVIWQSCCIRAKVVLIGQKWLFSLKTGSIRAKAIVFKQKWFYLGKSGCIPAKFAVFVKSGCIWAKWFFSGKVVVFGKNLLYSG